MRETSLEAYEDVKPELGERQAQVLNALKSESTPSCMNNRMIAEYLGLRINSVTPRVKELREKGLVEEAGRSLCPYSKRRTIFWRTTERGGSDGV